MKYAPPRADGLKPWVVTRREWGRERELIVYAETRGEAAYIAKGQMLYVTATARRATVADMEALGEA